MDLNPRDRSKFEIALHELITGHLRTSPVDDHMHRLYRVLGASPVFEIHVFRRKWYHLRRRWHVVQRLDYTGKSEADAATLAWAAFEMYLQAPTKGAP